MCWYVYVVSGRIEGVLQLVLKGSVAIGSQLSIWFALSMLMRTYMTSACLKGVWYRVVMNQCIHFKCFSIYIYVCCVGVFMCFLQ